VRSRSHQLERPCCDCSTPSPLSPASLGTCVSSGRPRMVRIGPIVFALAAWGGAATKLHAPPSRPPLMKAVPFSKIADEIHDAEVAAEELQYKVKNSTEEKASVQWFLATAMKELTNLQKVVMNRTVKGTLGYEYQGCLNRTSAKLPTYNRSLTFKEAVDQDDDLAPSTVDARMYEVYEAEQKIEELTMRLGECSAKCPLSLLSRARAMAKRRRREGPHPRELMKGVAEAIYNTSHEIDQMKDHLKKDLAAKNVLGKLSAMIMEKLLRAKEDVKQMRLDLEICKHSPSATFINDAVKEAMSEDTELSVEIVKEAADQSKDIRERVDDLEAKLQSCQKRCD